MKLKENSPTLITEHIFEILHDASGKFLDIKGQLADAVRTSKILPDWQIDANGIKFYDATKLSDKEMDAFVGHNFIRLINYKPHTRNYFQEKSEKFFKTIHGSKLYDIPTARRFGIRTKAFLPQTERFEKINEKLFNFFYKDNIAKLFGGVQKDLQIIIQVKQDDFQIKICLGPLKPDEANKYFSFKSDEFSKPGIYIDVDCFQENSINYQKIGNLTNKAMEFTWSKIDTLLTTIGG